LEKTPGSSLTRAPAMHRNERQDRMTDDRRQKTVVSRRGRISSATIDVP
jgi:hypothetical protein